jgi:hypothetical protein
MKEFESSWYMPTLMMKLSTMGPQWPSTPLVAQV